jgi:PadR family transcriptional regulator, regulatory protein PadR
MPLMATYIALQGMLQTNGNGDRSQNWEAQLRKGCLEMAILASLWPSRLYGLEVLRALSEESHLDVAEGTLYPILSRLKAEGLLQSEWVEAEAGHPRKYYWLTPAGRRRAREMASAWNEFSANLSTLVQPILAGGKIR